MEDRRRSERAEANLHAQWQTPTGVQDGTVINCSTGGCFVQALVEEPGNEPLRLAILLPNGKSIQLWGEVAYYLPTMGFGLQFTRVANQDQSMYEAWSDYLKTNPAVAKRASAPAT